MNATGTVPRRKGGQAIIELAIAMIAVMVLLAALLQLGLLTREQENSMQEARGRADEEALAAVYRYPSAMPEDLRGWQPGPDRIAHSRDDRSIAGNSEGLREEIIAVSMPDDLNARISGNRISTLMRTGQMAMEFDLVSGRADARVVPLLPLTQRLFYDADSLSLENDVWMVWLRDIP
ncbi:MAG: hypothetical protein U1E27_02885 [Kiritimatiellia bacterium]|nr:hypothetical protein [Kiritimatiellia bacterium]